jgi:hypothetical protein
MRRKVAPILLATGILLVSPPALTAPPLVNPAHALPGGETGPQVVGSSALVENPLPWDGKTILFTGEAIGEAQVRGRMAWIHLNDDAYMWRNLEEGASLGGYNTGQAVWASATEAGRISFFGDYKHEGDVVTAQGRFNAACREHGGDMDIHATGLTVVTAGHRVHHVVNWRRGGIAAGLLFASLLLWLARRRAMLRRI